MGFSIYSLLKAIVLLMNAVAVLHEKRFLAKLGWSASPMDANATSMKSQLLGLVYAVQYARVPLIAVNSVVIVIELLFG